jgi:hypothetical protein
MTVGLAMVMLAAAIVLVLLRHPVRAAAPAATTRACLNTPVYSLMARYGVFGWHLRQGG